MTDSRNRKGIPHANAQAKPKMFRNDNGFFYISGLASKKIRVVVTLQPSGLPLHNAGINPKG
ncbi:MAG: hypothetical protein DRJ05_07290 [Bacteroidetes bacterium]|nr:MAG: hypothetical protein DRJ05_07290 [Bacteroidota bacterium]